MNWKYQTLCVQNFEFDQTLEREGKHGWELVCVVKAPVGEYTYYLFFKRPA